MGADPPLPSIGLEFLSRSIQVLGSGVSCREAVHRSYGDWWINSGVMCSRWVRWRAITMWRRRRRRRIKAEKLVQ
ncbi:hypothetical protein MUK42_34227 [Musa troglodytarum]|uniref:Uncharacterized protein n=1 Tax=Musa troglodytarum TaxID=320322 RepID=A0A9E7J8P1_9LILI|nr:hypothetical protein MUK42_34227 [Musa troglodytarum]